MHINIKWLGNAALLGRGGGGQGRGRRGELVAIKKRAGVDDVGSCVSVSHSLLSSYLNVFGLIQL